MADSQPIGSPSTVRGRSTESSTRNCSAAFPDEFVQGSDVSEDLERPFLKFENELRASGFSGVNFPGDISDLDNEIHPIFREENWIRGSYPDDRVHSPVPSARDDELWSRLSPALRFATLLITERKFMSWWIRTLFGRVTEFTSTRAHWHLEYDDAETTDDSYMAVEKRFMEMAGRIKFCFGKVDAHAETNGNVERLSDGWEKFDAQDIKDTEGVYSYIRFRDDYERYVLSAKENSTILNDLRFQFFFAVALVHELAHAFYLFRAGKSTNGEVQPIQEIYWDEMELLQDTVEPHPEMGLSWEIATFTSVLCAHPDPNEGIAELCYYVTLQSEHNPDFLLFVHSDLRIALDPMFMYRCFRKQQWKYLDNLFLPAPRVGTVWMESEEKPGNFEWVLVSAHEDAFDKHDWEFWRLKLATAFFKVKEDRLKELADPNFKAFTGRPLCWY